MKKMLMTALAVVLIVVISVSATLAYLTDSASVENTFTVGKVVITLDEAKVDPYGVVLTGEAAGRTEDGIKYKLIPGHTYTKDPTIHVGDESEDCWLLVKVENGLGGNATIKWETDWTRIEGTDIWAYAKKASANSEVKVFSEFTYSKDVTDTADDAAKAIKVTAYAIQADGFASAEAAWATAGGQF